MVKVSAVIITRNEAYQIQRTLNALKWCDEIVVVDSGSSDDTVELCRAFGCKVFYNEFQGFGSQKNFAVKRASNDWVFVVDADEVCTPELALEVRYLLNNGKATHAGYYVRRQAIFLGKKMRFGGEPKKGHLRLFNRQHGNYNNALVHENVDLKGSTGRLKYFLLHNSYTGIAHYFDKFNQYTSAGAKEVVLKGRVKGKPYIMFRFGFTFIQIYFFKGLIFDGYPGFIWSLFSAMYPVVKYAKALEMVRENK